MVEYISKELRWLRPFLQEVSHMIPLDRLKRISARRPHREFSKAQRCHGIISHYKWEDSYKITIYLCFIDIDKIDPPKFVMRPYSTIDTLCFMAHELAHMVHWEHTPDHKILENQIIQIFMQKLKTMGYKSEEEEGEKSYFFGCRK
jgi:hypothetical protein